MFEEQELSALAISLVACVIMLCGAASGVLFHRVLPEHHLNSHSKDIVRSGSALIATISALVLGLLITSAKNTFDTQRNEVREITAKFILVDNQLKRYGPEARHARELLRQSVGPTIDRIWGERAVKSATGAPFQPSEVGDLLYAAIEALSPQNDVQHTLKYQALQTTTSITEERVLLFEQSDAGLPTPLLAVLIFWLTILMASSTLFSPVNPTGGVALVIIALSASGAIFLILEMNTPFTGLMQIPSAPLRTALGTLGS
jgi:Protein of unknown function (DUF4239)